MRAGYCEDGTYSKQTSNVARWRCWLKSSWHLSRYRGTELLAEFTALKTTFSTACEGQVDAKGDLAQARANVASTRTALGLQLGKNILAIASHHIGSPERVNDYFNQSLLEDPTRSNDDVTKAVTPPMVP